MRYYTSATAAAVLLSGPMAFGAIMIDFGSVAPSNSLYAGHVVNGGTIPDDQTTWTGTTAVGGDNSAVNDLAAGAVFNADGTVAAGVSVDLGFLGSYATQPTHRITGAGFRGANGVFNNNVGRDYLGRDDADHSDTIMVRISGLALGTYDVWTYTRYAFHSTTTTAQLTSYVGAGDVNTNIFSEITNTASVTYAGNGNSAHVDLATWTAGATFVKLQATLTAQSPDLLIGVNGAVIGPQGNGGVALNAIQINAVPEPTSMALVALAGVLGLRRRRGAVRD